MSTVIYLSNQRVQVVTGKGGASKIKVEATYSADAPDGSIINGIIMEQELFINFLKDFWKANKLPAKGVDLVINSTKFVGKSLEIPALKEAAAFEFIQREFADITRGEDNLFSQIKLGSADKGIEKRYIESINADFIREYINIFDSAGIKLNGVYSGESAIISLIGKTIGQKYKTFVIEIADSMTLSTVVWVDGSFYYHNSVRCFNEQGTMEYAQDIARSVSQITQFLQAHQVESPLEAVVLAGVDPMDLDLYSQGLMMQGIQLDAEMYDSVGAITSTAKGDIQKFLYSVSGLFNDEKTKNFIANIKLKSKAGNKKPLPIGIIVVVLTFVVMIAITVCLILSKNASQKALDDVLAYNEDPMVQLQVMDYDTLTARNEFLDEQYRAINEVSENLMTYPACNRDVIEVIQECAKGYAEIEISSFDANSGVVSTSTYAENVDDINKFITRLLTNEIFSTVNYTGYTFDNGRKMWNVNVMCTLAESVGR